MRQSVSALFGVLAVVGMVALAPAAPVPQDPDLGYKCPAMCKGLTSSDPMWWVYGCYSLPPQCSGGGGADAVSLESKVRTLPTAPKPSGVTPKRRPVLAMRGGR